MNLAPRQTIEDKFMNIYETATELKKCGKFYESLQMFRKAESYFDNNIKNTLFEQENLYNYIRTKIDIVKLELKISLKKSQKNRFIERSQSLLKKLFLTYVQSTLKKTEKSKLLYQLYSDFGDIFTQTYQIFQQSEFSEICCFLELSRNCYQMGKKQILNLISHANSSQQKEFAQQEYLKSILNILNPLLLQGNKNQQIVVFKLIYKFTSLAQKFYKQSNNQQKLRQILAKMYYYRGVAAQFLGMHNQSEVYLLKDKKYCESKNLKQDLNKTKQQLLKFYLRQLDFQKAEKYILAGKEQQFNNQKKWVTKTSNRLTQISKLQFIPKEEKQISKQLTNLFQQLIQAKYFKIIEPFILKNINIFNQFKQIKWVLHYYLAENYYEKKQYQKGFIYTKQGLNLVQKYTPEHIDQYLQYLWFLYRLENRSLVQCYEEFKRINMEVSRRGYITEQQRADNEHKIKEMQFAKHRKQIFNLYLENNFFQSQKERQLFNEDFRIQDQNYQIISPMVIKKDISLTEKYSKICLQKNLPLRKFILDKIKVEHPQNISDESILSLKELFLFQSKEIAALISLFSISDWDFRNFQFNKEFLTELEINNLSYSSVKAMRLLNPVIKTQRLFKFLQFLQNVQLIHLQSFTIPKKINIQAQFFRSISNPLTLKILKIKNCSIQDSFLPILSNFSNLQKLNLSQNFIKGYQLQVLQILTHLRSLNLSGNPLHTQINYSSSKILQKFKLKNLKSTFEQHYIINSVNNSAQSNFLIQQICQSELLDLSLNSQKIIIQMLKASQAYCWKRRNAQLQNLKKLVIRKVNVTLEILSALKMIILASYNFETLDMRFCYWGNLDVENYVFNEYTQKNKHFNFDFQGKSHIQHPQYQH